MTGSDPLLAFLQHRAEGLYCPALDAYLDPPGAVPRALISHAHSDHAVEGHGEIWATRQTLAIYRRRHPAWQGAAREISVGTAFESGGIRLEAHWSGHILGAVQWRFDGGGESLLYTGDFQRRASITAERVETPQADVLLTETTFGLPVFRFPPRDDVQARLIAACREAIDRGEIPVLLAYALGKAQEAAAVLTRERIPTVLHGAAWKLLPEFEAEGFTFPLSRGYETGPARPGEALIVPPRCARTPVVTAIKKRRVVYLSGWAVRSAARADFDADVLLPFSDHADFDELLEHVAQVAPRRVVTHHGFARDFARILGQRGIDAQALAEPGERAEEDRE
jgi:Cft2 family RNA processing exonuclease